MLVVSAALGVESTGLSETLIFAVGDLAECDKDAPHEAPTARVAQLVKNSMAPILMLGDLAYPRGSESDFSNCFAPVWGELKERILPVPGNHEYETAGAKPYFDYFSDRASSNGLGYFVAQIDRWRVIGLNSNIDVSGDSVQERWLKRVLAARPGKCTVAFWHHPRFSSGHHGDTPAMGAIWRDLHDAAVDIVIVGHDHDYERFAPQGPMGEHDPDRGIREFVVGSGGATLRPFEQIKPNSEVTDRDHFGVLKLTLGDAGYTWEFVAVDSDTFRDHGESLCHK